MKNLKLTYTTMLFFLALGFNNLFAQDPAIRQYTQTGTPGNYAEGVEILDGNVTDGDNDAVSFGATGTTSGATSCNIHNLTLTTGIKLLVKNQVSTLWEEVTAGGTIGYGANYNSGTLPAYYIDYAIQVDWDQLTAGDHVITWQAFPGEGTGVFWFAYTVTIKALEDGSATGPTIVAPTVTTSAATSVGQYSAVLNGNVTATGEENPTRYFFTSTNTQIANLGTGGVAAFNYTWNGLSPNTSYTFYASATNSVGTGSGSNQTFLTLPGDPAVAAESNLTPTRVTANWTAPTNGATSYFVQLATDAGFNTIVSSQSTASTSHNFTGLTPLTDYYYRVYASNATGNSNYSGTRSFSTPRTTPLTQATNILFSNVSRTGMTVSWTRGSGNSCILIARDQYRIPLTDVLTDLNAYTANSNYSAGIAVNSCKVVYENTGSSCNVTGLSRYSLVYFKIMEFNEYYNDENYYLQTTSTNSMRSRWTLRRDGLMEEDLSIDAEFLYPNPAKNSISTTMDLFDKGLVIAKLYDYEGRVVKHLYENEHDFGTYDLTFDISDVPTGVYQLIITKGNELIRYPLSVVR